MSENTAIEWADHTFNPWIGCQAVSPGCDNCYAEAIVRRFKTADWGPGAERKPQSDAYWDKPFQWDLQARRSGERLRVFCASMADVFDNRAPEGARDRLWHTIRNTPMLSWLLLTKRPENIRRMLPDDWHNGYANVWLGISAERQKEFDHRWPLLAKVPGAIIRFLSYEPAIESLSITGNGLARPDWVIMGGESGPKARPMSPYWAAWTRRECKMLDIPFFFKQWGSYQNNPQVLHWGLTVTAAKKRDPHAKGGALLEGRLWREFPEERRVYETEATVRGDLPSLPEASSGV